MSTLLTMYAAQANSPFTTTLGEISASATSVTVDDASVLPSSIPFLLTLGYDKTISETVQVNAVNGNTLTIVRGLDGPALMWVAGTKCARVLTAKDLNDIQANIRLLNDEKAEPGDIPSPSSVNPTMDGTAAAGTSNDYARADHVHPSDTGKQDAIGANGILKSDGQGNVIAAQAGTDYQAPLEAGTDYATPDSVPAAASAAPQMDGTAAAGSSSDFARADHVHPTDTGKQDKITASGVLAGDGNGNIMAVAVDTAPSFGSSNLITSGAVYTAILGAIGGSY